MSVFPEDYSCRSVSLWILAVSVLGLTGLGTGCGGNSEAGSAVAEAHEVAAVGLYDFDDRWLQRGPSGEIIAIARLETLDPTGMTNVDWHGYVSEDGGKTWTDTAIGHLQYVSMTEVDLFDTFAASGPDGVHVHNVFHQLFGANAAWSAAETLPEATAGLAGSGGAARKVADLFVDDSGKQHYLSSASDDRLWYYRVSGGVEQSFAVGGDTFFDEAAFLYGPGDEAWAVFFQNLTPLEFIAPVKRSFARQILPGDQVGNAVPLGLCEAVENFVSEPSGNGWSVVDLQARSMNGTGHVVAVVMSTVGDTAIVHRLRSAEGWGTPHVVDYCTVDDCRVENFGLKQDLTFYEADPAASLYLLVRRRYPEADGERSEIAVARMLSDGPSALIRSSRFEAFVEAAPSLTRESFQILQWPVLEFFYREERALVYANGGIGQDGGGDNGFDFDAMDLLRATSTSPTHVVAFLGRVPDSATISPAACTVKPALTITAARPAPRGAGLVLDTASQEAGTTYTLSCPGIADPGGIAASGEAVFTGFGTAKWPGRAVGVATRWLDVDASDNLWSEAGRMQEQAQFEFGLGRLGPERVFLDQLEFPPSSAEQAGFGAEQAAVSDDGRLFMFPGGTLGAGVKVLGESGWSDLDLSTLSGPTGDGQQVVLVKAGDGGVWMATGDWLHRIDVSPVESIDLAPLGGARFAHLDTGPDGRIWVVTTDPTPLVNEPDLHAGLSVYDGAWTKLEQSAKFGEQLGGFARLAVTADGTVFAIVTAAHEQFGGTGVLTYLVVRDGEDAWSEVSIVHGESPICADSGGRVWAGADGGNGGIVTHGTSGPVTVPTEGAFARQIVEDRNGSLWVATSDQFRQDPHLERIVLDDELLLSPGR